MKKKTNLTSEEKKLLNSIEKGEWSSVKNLKSEIKKSTQYAKNTIKKDQRINIRISSKDLHLIQTIAIEDGIPYQTLISSILHKFASGKLHENKI